jgi:hypothetical protein
MEFPSLGHPARLSAVDISVVGAPFRRLRRVDPDVSYRIVAKWSHAALRVSS